MRTRRWWALAGWLALPLLAGAAGAVASLDAREFYAALVRPAWAPPGGAFGPVWTALYLMMGTAAWLVWQAEPATAPLAEARRTGLRLFVVQLALNAAWTWLFFAWRLGAAALGEIVTLWAFIAATAWCFGRARRIAGWLLVPYLAWVTFATALTWALWRANPGLL